MTVAAKSTRKKKAAKKPSVQTLKLERSKRNPRSKYWRVKADEVFMAQYRNLECEVCLSMFSKSNTQSTVGHHLLPKGSCPAHRFTHECMLVLCMRHHLWDDFLAAHSMNALAVRRFLDWMEMQMPEQYKWMQEHEHDQERVNYKEVWEQYSDE